MAKAPTLLGVQYLRAIAALMVAYFHLTGQLPAYTPIILARLGGDLPLDAGVDIFFAISGFIMLVTSRGSTPGGFFVKRLIRIVPLYWLMTLAVVAAALLSPGTFHSTVVTAGGVARSLLFIPYSNPDYNGQVFPLLVPGWSLNFEMFFYLVFACALLVSLSQRLIVTGIFFVLLVALARLLPSPEQHPVLMFFANLRVFEFWLGMLIGWLYLEGRLSLGKRACWALILASAWVLMRGIPGLQGQDLSLVPTIFAAATLVLAIVSLENAGGVGPGRWMEFFGNASYSIYLSHIFALGIARVLWVHLYAGPPTLMPAIAFALFSMVLVLIVSALAYRVLEKPMLHGLQSLLQARKAVRAV